MIRTMFLLLGLGVCLASVGCALPVGCGPCGGGLACDSCGDCDGGYVGGHVVPLGPIEALRQAKRNLVCGGGGCGEVYHGEWRSYPPACAEPCDGGAYCGAANCGAAIGCAPCWAPGALLPRNLVPALYGKRMYQNYDESGYGSCGSCGGGCSGGCSDCGGVIEEGGAVMHSSGCNCGGHSDHAAPSYIPAEGATRVSPTPARTSMPRTSAPRSTSTRTTNRAAAQPQTRTSSARTMSRPTQTPTRTR
jgi:hypothetical protein